MPTNTETWNRIAGWWDDQIGEAGNAFHRRVIGPAAEALLEVTPGQRILDVACGNGQFSRQLVRLGATVTAFDQSSAFVDRAKRYDTTGIDYHVIDATDETAVKALGTFDGAVANMALMDMPDIGPLFRALSAVLHPGGRFVSTILHPCFGYGPAPSAAQRGVASIGARIPKQIRTPAARVIDAVTAARSTQIYLDARQLPATSGIPGQPEPHTYFHRPLHELLAPAFDNGFVLDGLLEPRHLVYATGRPALLAARLTRR